MRLTSGDSRCNPHMSVTKSLIEDGSEDFTNIDEHLQDETKISCRNAVDQSLNNVTMSKFPLHSKCEHIVLRKNGIPVNNSPQQPMSQNLR